MKKLLLLLSVIFISCSGSDDSTTTNGQLTFNNQSYGFDHAYIQKVEGNEYFIYLTKGSIEFDFSQIETTATYSPDFKRVITMTVSGSSLEGAKLFPSSPNTNSDNYIVFYDNYVIQNGQPSEFDTVFTYTDNISDQSRVFIHKVNETTYSFDFNVITTTGILTGKYTGAVTKTNF